MWSFPTNQGPAGVAMTYMFDGKQYMAVARGPGRHPRVRARGDRFVFRGGEHRGLRPRARATPLRRLGSARVAVYERALGCAELVELDLQQPAALSRPDQHKGEDRHDTGGDGSTTRVGQPVAHMPANSATRRSQRSGHARAANARSRSSDARRKASDVSGRLARHGSARCASTLRSAPATPP